MSGCCASSKGHRATLPSVPISIEANFQAACVARSRAKLIPGGTYEVGTSQPVFPQDGEGPLREAKLKSFLISAFAVSNADFAKFVASTSYVTEAEEIGWSAVFTPHLTDSARIHSPGHSAPTWWSAVIDACWSRPEGGDSHVNDRQDHPVVHVSLRDAKAYAKWVGGRLPTEAEWEVAAKGGNREAIYPWGDLEPDDEAFQPCNIWQGSFPKVNTCLDGYAGTCPVDAYSENGLGLFNMSGNTWEWTTDFFRVRSLAKWALQRNEMAKRNLERVLKGGSYLCHKSYCHRYRIAARSPAPPSTATGHLGFRVVFQVK